MELKARALRFERRVSLKEILLYGVLEAAFDRLEEWRHSLRSRGRN